MKKEIKKAQNRLENNKVIHPWDDRNCFLLNADYFQDTEEDQNDPEQEANNHKADSKLPHYD